MIITGIRTGIVSIPLRKPFKTALRTLEHLRSTVVAVDTDTGAVGWGEAPPTGAITGDSLDGIRGAICDFIAPKLIGRSVAELDPTLAALEASCVHNTSAKAAVDGAIHDLWGQLHGRPLYQLLGGCRSRIETDLTISVNPPAEMVADAREAVARGFRILKVKVGRDPKLDLERIGAIRAAVGAAAVIRIDANQGWRVKEAITIMRAIETAGLDIELVEQPLPAADFDGMRRVREAIATPVLADESVFSASDAQRLLAMGAADYLNIKLMKTGGIRPALRVAALAETAGVECFMGCMMESKLSVTAAVHLAAAKGIITRYDLDSPSLCAADPVRGGVTIDGPWLSIPDRPGLGIDGVDGVAWD